MDDQAGRSGLLEVARQTIRKKHYRIRTEEVYLGWMCRFICAHEMRHPRDKGAAEVRRFPTYLAMLENVAASTQNQALSAILYLYHDAGRQYVFPASKPSLDPSSGLQRHHMLMKSGGSAQ